MIWIHPPRDDKKRAFKRGDRYFPVAAYLYRNHRIVKSVELMIACPGGKKEIIRSGTWATMRYAEKRETEMLVIYPDGTVDSNWKSTAFDATWE